MNASSSASVMRLKSSNITRCDLFHVEAHELAAQPLGLDGGAQLTSLTSLVA
jgi:hypothetical protein